MRRFVMFPLLVAALAGPGTAQADVLIEYESLAERELHPAPLVFTTAPPSLRPIDRTLEPLASRRRAGYGLRLFSDAANAVVVLQGGSFKDVRGALRDARRLGMRAVRTRVRGHRGQLLSRPGERTLLWVEGGVVYTLGARTTKAVSLPELRATANGLDRLRGAYSGSGGDPDLGTGAVMVTTRRTVTASVEWAAHCVAADGLDRSDRGGSARFTLLPLDGATFRAEIASRGWTGTVEGTVHAESVDVTVRAITTVDGATCDTGAVTFTAGRTRGK
jgi:hypothetical protein